MEKIYSKVDNNCLLLTLNRKKDITTESDNIEYDSQGLFLGVVLNGLNQGPEKAIELGYMALANQTINFADKAYLAKIIKEGTIDKNYLTNVLKEIKAVTVKEIKQYGYNATINRLNDKVKQASTKEQKVNYNIYSSFDT